MSITPDSPEDSLETLSLQSRVVSAGRPERTSDAGVNVGIELNSTFLAPGPTGYGRYGNNLRLYGAAPALLSHR